MILLYIFCDTSSLTLLILPVARVFDHTTIVYSRVCFVVKVGPKTPRAVSKTVSKSNGAAYRNESGSGKPPTMAEILEY